MGPWSKFRKMGKRSKSLPRAPQQIRLPDSAVSGTTIGGHRHIAISIPLEVTPFADVPRSQYPVYTPRDLTTAISTRDAAKVEMKLFRPRPGTSQAPKSARPDDNPLTPSHWIRPGALDFRSQSAGREKPHDYIGILPAQLDTTSLNDSTAPWNCSAPKDDGLGYYRLSNSSPQQSPQQPPQQSLPARSSSAVRLRGKEQHASIDSLISQQQRQRWRQQHQRSRDAADRLPGATPLSSGGSKTLITGSAANTDTSDWGKPRKSSTILGIGSERPAAPNKQDSRASGLTVIADSPIVSHRDPSPAAAPAPTLPRNRREVVRDRKQRDMEAVRKLKQVRRVNGTIDTKATSMISRVEETEVTVHESLDDALEPTKGNDESSSTQRPSNSMQHLSISNMVVVADFKPSPSGKAPTGLRTSKAMSISQSAAAGLVPSEQRAQLDEPSMPTPPISARGTSPTMRATADRTSLTRRREWKAIREQERKAREAIAMTRVETQGLAQASVTSEGKGSQADKELMNLYEAYREHRLRDMERRLRRLERNGDVWLRALVPVLDNLNRTLATAATKGLPYREEDEDCESEEEARKAPKRLGLDADRRHASRRRSLAQGRLLERRTRHKEGANRGNEDDDDNDDYNGHGNSNGTWRDSESGSDDTSGLGSIEPLMRELAGEARRRQRAAAMAAARVKGQRDEGPEEERGEAGKGKGQDA